MEDKRQNFTLIIYRDLPAKKLSPVSIDLEVSFPTSSWFSRYHPGVWRERQTKCYSFKLKPNELFYGSYIGKHLNKRHVIFPYLVCHSKWLHLNKPWCRVMLRSFYFRIMWLCDDCGKLFGRRRPIRKHTKTTQLHLGSCQMFYWVKIKKKNKWKFRPGWMTY